MRPILIVSLIGNVALAAGLIFYHGTSLRQRLEHTIHPATTAAPEKTNQARIADALTAGLKKNDPAVVRDQLRALGIPEDVVRGIIQALVNRSVVALRQQIAKSRNSSLAAWGQPTGSISYSAMTREQRMALLSANRAASKQVDDLLGVDPDDPTAYRSNFLSPDKAGKIRALERDYNDLRFQVNADTQGFSTPADAEKIAYLDNERRADLAAVLTPDELAEYDMLSSPTAGRLHYRLQDFSATEDEFKKIYAAQTAREAQFESTGRGPVSDEQVQARRAAQLQIEAKLQADLGDARYLDYQRSQDPDYQQLEAAAKRFDLPTASVGQVYNARDQALAQAQNIANNTSLTDDQRRQLFTELATQTRGQIMNALGDEAGSAYLMQNMHWLRALGNGVPIASDVNGIVHPAPRVGSSRE